MTTPNTPSFQSLGDGSFYIDENRLRQAELEAERTSRLLDDMFTEEVEVEIYSSKSKSRERETSDSRHPLGLDDESFWLVRTISEKPVWNHAELAALCRERGILFEGALEIINAGCYAEHHAPLVFFEDDEVFVDADLLREIFDEG